MTVNERWLFNNKEYSDYFKTLENISIQLPLGNHLYTQYDEVNMETSWRQVEEAYHNFRKVALNYANDEGLDMTSIATIITYVRNVENTFDTLKEICSKYDESISLGENE